MKKDKYLRVRIDRELQRILQSVASIEGQSISKLLRDVIKENAKFVDFQTRSHNLAA